MIDRQSVCRQQQQKERKTTDTRHSRREERQERRKKKSRLFANPTVMFYNASSAHSSSLSVEVGYLTGGWRQSEYHSATFLASFSHRKSSVENHERHSEITLFLFCLGSFFLRRRGKKKDNETKGETGELRLDGKDNPDHQQPKIRRGGERSVRCTHEQMVWNEGRALCVER